MWTQLEVKYLDWWSSWTTEYTDVHTTGLSCVQMLGLCIFFLLTFSSHVVYINL